MEILFKSEFGVLDLSNIRISLQENNAKVSDAMFTKFALPFEVYATHDFIEKFGDFVSYESNNLKNKIKGFLELDGNLHDAELFIQSIEGYKLTCQLDFGFEELPNFDKKLSELPLENFPVNDIHTYAKGICAKTYPATNFNFPRIYTEKYNPESDPWKAFDGYYNDLKPDGSEMRRNYIDGNGTPFNVNIIHPCPHILYLLKTGFADAGYSLEGEILTDQNLAQKWVFSGTEYFSSLVQRRYGLTINFYDYYDTFFGYADVKYGKYTQNLTIEKPGNYIYFGNFTILQSGSNEAFLKIYKNGNLILHIWSPTKFNTMADAFLFNLQTFLPNEVITVEIYSIIPDNPSQTMFTSELVGKELDVVFDQNTDVITNLNEINLKKAVPEITFGDLVKCIKNWFNYDVEVKNKTVIMNKIISDIGEVKDFRFAEIPIPKRNLLNKKSFLLKFPEMDKDYKKDSIYFDSDGAKLNGTEKTDTNIIDIRGYLMGVKQAKLVAPNTAFVGKDSTDLVALVEYKGLENLQNNASYSTGCDFPELFYNNWEKWLKQRINGQEFSWKKLCNTAEISQLSIKDYIFAFNNVHIIKSLNKEKVGENTFEVEFTTETVV